MCIIMATRITSLILIHKDIIIANEINFKCVSKE